MELYGNLVILQKFKNVYRIKLSIHAENFNFKVQSFDEVDKIARPSQNKNEK